ncbi:M-phase phosphoprotein 9 isoform X2 [Lampris incognitus]|uniref:M-phase phosphoprotein 9 isoform X2 n=1 Tax=Lampris incognitus TaxID=2546036 RepID=UPI0024B5333E|nr:M-phase phosphoprotein 9 isoform X2 [Lampris incognitus]
MSTDDSISEDVSSSGALSHCHVSGDGDGGKGSEASLVSSEGTSASGVAGPEDGHTRTSATRGTVENRSMDITPACNKIRSLCLSSKGAFVQGKNLPFINPSSLETLRALVQEIQSSGETDPEIWKDCEGRWLHLFQLVEKQYQEQILAQQEQYQCQIQLIQDEIKALVQLQNRQSSGQQHTDFLPTPAITTTTDTKEYILPFIPNDPSPLTNLSSGADCLSASVQVPFSSPSPPLHRPETTSPGDGEPAEVRSATVMSSGYGTLSTWETGLEKTGSPREVEEASQLKDRHDWPSVIQEQTEPAVTGCQRSSSTEMPPRAEASSSLSCQQKSSGVNQPLTSWAQRQKARPKKNKAGQAPSQVPDSQEQPLSPRQTPRHSPLEDANFQLIPTGLQHPPDGPSPPAFILRRSDSLVSEVSGLTYWRLNESDLYRPLPDSFDSGTYLLLQEASMSLAPSQEPQLSLREIYQSKQKADSKRTDWDGSLTSCPSSPQVLTLDPALNVRQSDRTSGFTSPSHFSSPSFPTQPQLDPRAGTHVTSDSMVDCSANRGDTDCISSTSSLSVTTPSSAKVESFWGKPSQGFPTAAQDKMKPCSLMTSQQRRASAPLASEEEGSHTHTSTLKPSDASPLHAAGPRVERASSFEDPVVLSLLRQDLRQKHSRHIADVKAYYESEIQALRDKLSLRELPPDMEKSNQTLRKRCRDLERALAEAARCIEELEAKNAALEKKLVEWPQRYAVAGATVKSLQQRLEESKRSGNEKDTSVAHLKTRVRQLEEAAQSACKEADEKDATRARENKMLQDLLGEYDSLRKDHEGVKDKLISTENKLVDANEQISELKRVISKLESQVKQLEHENQARLRYASHSNTQPSGAGLYHHPDLLLSPTKSRTVPDLSHRKSSCPPSDHPSSAKKSPYPQTNRKSPCTPNDQSNASGGSVNNLPAKSSWRCFSPPEREHSHPESRHQSQPQEPFGKEPGRREGPCPMTPVMMALIELEETRATESRAPWVSNQRTAAGFVERIHREPVQDPVGLAADVDMTHPGRGVAGPERKRLGATGCGTGQEKAAPLGRAQRGVSPEGHRSSSLPPPVHCHLTTTTPTKRETLLTPLSAKSSPKRCPTENYSTAFGHLLPRHQHMLQRLDGPPDQRRHSFHIASPRKRLSFTAPNKKEDPHQQCSISADSTCSVNPVESSWEDQEALIRQRILDTCEDPGLFLQDKLGSLADAERLFDELTQEKLQVEAALSRMPGAGGRVSLQTRLDEVALEKRLERLNRELGSIRMTLKRFHVLRSSTNI